MTAALDWLVLAVVTGSAAAAIAWAIDALLGRKIPPAVSCALWTVALAKFLVPVGPAALFAVQPALSPAPYMIWAGAGVAAAAPIAAGPLWWPSIAFGAYLLIAAGIAARHLLSARRLSRSIAALPAASAALVSSVQEAASALGLRAVPAVRVGAGPFVAGLFRPTLVVPFKACETAEARAVLLHELAHLRRRDHWVRALQAFARIAFFFWPPAHWVSRRIEQHRELACDQLAIERGGLSPAAYARVLLDAFRNSVRGPSSLAVLEMAPRSSNLEARIDRLLRLDRPRSTKWAAVAVVACVALALSGAAIAVDGASAGAAKTADANQPKAAANAAGVLTEAEVRAIVHANRGRVEACYAAALADHPGLEGTMLLHWGVAWNGSVREVCETSADFTPKLSKADERKLSLCISAAIQSWTFPAHFGKDDISISHPFAFSPKVLADRPVRFEPPPQRFAFPSY